MAKEEDQGEEPVDQSMWPAHSLFKLTLAALINNTFKLYFGYSHPAQRQGIYIKSVKNNALFEKTHISLELRSNIDFEDEFWRQALRV